MLKCNYISTQKLLILFFNYYLINCNSNLDQNLAKTLCNFTLLKIFNEFIELTLQLTLLAMNTAVMQ